MNNQPVSADTVEEGSFIDMLDPANILSWSYRLVVTPIELKQAVAKVGASTAKVRVYLGLSEFEVWPFSAHAGACSAC